MHRSSFNSRTQFAVAPVEDRRSLTDEQMESLLRIIDESAGVTRRRSLLTPQGLAFVAVVCFWLVLGLVVLEVWR